MNKSIGCMSLICLALIFPAGPAAWAQGDNTMQSDEAAQSDDTAQSSETQAVSPETSDADNQATPQQPPEDAATNSSSEEPAGQPEPDSDPNAQ
jgi:hypothetical protein